MLDTGLSGENGGDKVLMEHELENGEYVGEVCGEVRGERHNQRGGAGGEMDSKRSEGQPLISLPSARFCLSMSAWAEALRSHNEELALIAFCPLPPPLLSLSEAKEKKVLLSGT